MQISLTLFAIGHMLKNVQYWQPSFTYNMKLKLALDILKLKYITFKSGKLQHGLKYSQLLNK